MQRRSSTPGISRQSRHNEVKAERSGGWRRSPSTGKGPGVTENSAPCFGVGEGTLATAAPRSQRKRSQRSALGEMRRHQCIRREFNAGKGGLPAFRNARTLTVAGEHCRRRRRQRRNDRLGNKKSGMKLQHPNLGHIVTDSLKMLLIC